MNNVSLVGRLVADPELKFSPSGVAVCRFRLAVNRPFSNEQGEREADFINCIAWRKQAENLANYMTKGSLIGITGRIQTGSYEGQDGKRVYTTDVVAEQIQFLESKNNIQNNTQNQSNFTQNQQGNSFGHPTQQNASTTQNQQNNDPFTSGGPIEVSEDDLPF